MWQLISGLFFIAIFFFLFFMLKKGYDFKQQDKKESGRKD